MTEGKKYYIRRAGFFNANDHIFIEGRPGPQIINMLKVRSKQNPSGASAETLKHFGYY